MNKKVKWSQDPFHFAVLEVIQRSYSEELVSQINAEKVLDKEY